MSALVVYESMYGNTHAVADAVAAGISESMDVDVVSAADLGERGSVDLLVLGAPTHGWGLSRPSTRRGAVQAAEKPGSDLVVEPGAAGSGMREWLERMPCAPGRFAAFDTRMAAPLGLSGSAAKRIVRRMRRHRVALAGPPEGFTVSKQNRLLNGELERARRWGRQLAVSTDRSARS